MPIEMAPRAIGSGLDRPESVLALRDGRVYASDSRKGVVRVLPTPSSNDALVFPHDDFVPNGIALLHDGTFLIANIGSRGGLWRLLQGGRLEPFPGRPNRLPESPMGHAFPDALGRTWVALTTRRHPRELAFRKDVLDGCIGLIDLAGSFHLVAEGLGFPNEVRVDPSGRWLYVTETFARRLSRFEIQRDSRLGARQTVHQFGAGTFPDGFDFDSEGGVWVTSVVSNRLIEVRVDGEVITHLGETEANRVDAAEARFQSGSYGHADIAIGSTGLLQNVSSVAFAGADLRSMLLGNLSGTRLTAWTPPVAGLAPLHWHCGATVIDQV